MLDYLSAFGKTSRSKAAAGKILRMNNYGDGASTSNYARL
jgi:hypothetical protein